MPYIAILGRQPAISLSELVSLYPNSVTPLASGAALVDTNTVDFDRLGGTVKIARLINRLPNGDLQTSLKQAAKALHSQAPPGKLAIGFSLYGISLPPKVVFNEALSFKKQLRFEGISSRIVPGVQMTAAQIQHNQMISHGADIVLVASSSDIYIGQTIAVQDIANYGLRDYGRPARSSKVGMLPPKLAQIMINLANPDAGSTILDPFCGTGVILQEALLIGHPVLGSDISSDLMDMTKRNLEWLATNFNFTDTYQLDTGDATSMSWRQPFQAVVTEGYLGPALSSQPSASELTNLSNEAKSLTLNFLSNLRKQIDINTPVCLSLPAWRSGKSFERLNIIDRIEALGYTLKQFLPVKQTDLLYSREDQLVGRELIALRSA